MAIAKRAPTLLALAALGFTGSQAMAQDANLAPTFGATSLVSGFTPDPFTLELQAGGNLDASNIAASVGYCGGQIAPAPDFTLTYSSGDYPLIISVNSQSDTTLVVRAPDGRFLCDDDGAGNLNPLVALEAPTSGTYAIWVGTFTSGNGFPPATLSISELAEVKPGEVAVEATLNGSPIRLPIHAGGFIQASARPGAESCPGYVALTPDAIITGGGDMEFSVRSQSDTTLAVLTPDGSWLCDDDTGGDLNPRLIINSGVAGDYLVYVGNFAGAADFAAGELTVSAYADPGPSGGKGDGAVAPTPPPACSGKGC